MFYVKEKLDNKIRVVCTDNDAEEVMALEGLKCLMVAEKVYGYAQCSYS